MLKTVEKNDTLLSLVYLNQNLTEVGKAKPIPFKRGSILRLTHV
jgi:hypothetical protein